MPTTVRRPPAPRLSPDLVAAWGEIPSAVAADRLAGRDPVDPRIRPIRPFAPGARLVGIAVTAWCEPADYGPVHHAIAEARAGDVLVVAAGGRRDAAMIGDLLSGAARRKGIVGVVVDGAVRDTGTIAGWPDFHVFARWVMPRGPSGMERGSVNEPVVFGGVPVSPGDLVVGDDDGLAIVPRDVAASLLEPCRARVGAEIAWEADLAAGRSTIDTFNVPAARILQDG